MSSRSNVRSRHRFAALAFGVAGALGIGMLAPAPASAAVGGSISGTVSIPDDAPAVWMQAVRVSVLPDSPGGTYQNVPVDPATGTYTASELAPGHYRVQFSVGAYWDGTGTAGANLVSEYFDNTTAYGSAERIEVTDSAVTGINAALETGRTISGTVTLGAGADPEWMQGIRVSASRIDGNASGSGTVDPVTGAYTILGLAPGSYRVAFAANNYWTTDGVVAPNLVSEYFNDTTDYNAAAPVDVTAMDAHGVNASLAVGRSISGTITLAPEADPDWLRGVSVYASAAGGVGRSGTVDADTGEYTILGLADGSYTVGFSANSYPDNGNMIEPNLVPEYYDDALTSSTATPVEIEGVDRSGIDAELATGTSISGTVSIPDDAPTEWLKGIHVSAITADGEYVGALAYDPSTGAYTISRIPTGEFHIRFGASDYWNGSELVPVNLLAEYFDDSPTLEDATLVSTVGGPATGTDAQLEWGSRVAGTIDLRPLRDGAGDEGVGVTVTLTGEAGAADQGNYGDGLVFDDYTFNFTSLTPGTYRLAVTTYHWDSASQKPIPLTSQFVRFGEDTSITLEAGDAITGLNGVTRAADASISGTITGEGFDVPIDGILGSAIVYERLGDEWVRLPGTRFDTRQQTATPFEINLPAGTYTVGYESEFSTIGTDITEQWWEYQSTLAGATAIPLDGGDSHLDTNGVVRPLDWAPPVSPPSAPRSVNAVPGNGQAAVTWATPESDGGTAVTSYTVRTWPGGASETATSSTSHVVTGLTNGTSYTFTVIAKNSAGASPASDPSNPVTPSETSPPSSPFVDVPTDHLFFPAIAWLADSGISTGWDAGNGQRAFMPTLPVQRDAVAAFLYRYAGSPAFSPPEVSPFIDVPTNHPFYTQIAWLASTGISTGWDVGGGRWAFQPNSAIQRDAMAVFLYRYTQWSDPSAPSFTPSAQSPFIDVPTSHPFYAQIAWLASTGVSTGWDVGGGRWAFQPTWPIQRDAVAVFLHRHSLLPH